MRTLAHVSDLHFGRIDPDVVAALEADLIAQDPDLVVVSGDLTQRGRHHEFLAARAFLDRLARPVLVVPGNHDVPAFNLMSRFLRPYGRFSRHISSDLSPVVADDVMAVLGLNSARRLVRHWNWALGSLNRRQLARAARDLAAHGEGRVRVIVTHHPAVLPPAHRDGPMLFHAERALGAFAAARVDLLLSGHLHRTHADLVTVPTPGSASPPWPMVVAQAGSATSTRLRDESNGYNVVTLDTQPPRIAVATRAWTGAGFESVAMRAFARDDGRWTQAA
ncbi:metallophosphoesterase [Roseospira marina]|uniref:Metallophosphoesterase n=1 Tax=Roseospira marina TaxID=140057 RepID=A0A5M6IC52_9PROT|nr:metallophosphoesterase [Roseospira marina]KAA5605329.1 metallophosphoesterase [Roseospira marina]MBB4314800.1 3',5'-cyclic AMP phosphodiesterase CpdA [Roseospira marina]MBB5087789.1 3',5'-cyclic AMP phosphodiesterase CpdA [Roseospira marina]